MTIKTSASLVSTANLTSPSQPGFALPLFSIGGANDLFIQEIDELTSRVLTFKRFVGEADPLYERLPPVVVYSGDEQIFCFIDENKNVVAGTVQEIEKPVRQFLQRRTNEFSIALQAAELFGDKSEKRKARLRMRRVVLDTLGIKAAKELYEGSMLRSELWAALVVRAKSRESAENILKIRSRLRAYLEADGKITLDISALSPSDYKDIDLEEIKIELASDFSLNDQEDYVDKSSADPAPWPVTKRVEEISTLLRKTGRQEARIAIILREFLENREVGIELLKVYKDSAGFAQKILGSMNSLIANHKVSNNSDMLLTEAILEKALRDGFPINRAPVFIHFANHLGSYPKLNERIRFHLDRSNSYYVSANRTEIQEILDKALKTDE